MKVLRVVILVFLVALFGVFIGAPFFLVHDEVQGTLTSESVAPVSPAPPEAPPQPEPVQTPLSPKLTLLEPVIFPVENKGKTLGHVRAQRGITVDLVADNGSEVTVKLVNSTVSIPRHAVAATDAPAPVEAPSSLSGNVRAAGQRVVDYWFPAAPAALSLEAHERATSRNIDRKWETWWGSYDRDYLRTKTLQVEVRNVSRRASGSSELGIYWIGKCVADDHRFIHHRAVYSLNVANLSTEYRELICPPLKANVTNYALAGVRYESGAKIEGWMAVLRRNNQTISCVASSPSLKAVGEDEAQYSGLMASDTSDRVVRTR